MFLKGYAYFCLLNLLTARKQNSRWIRFCSDSYCLQTDGSLRYVTDLEDAQNQCKDGMWLLEIYESGQQELLLDNLPKPVPILLNAVGTITEEFTSVLGTQLSNNVEIVYRKKDCLNIQVFDKNLVVSSADATDELPFVCSYEDRYEIIPKKLSWFNAMKSCTSSVSFPEFKGQLATFDGMNQVAMAKLPFVKNLEAGRLYWIGYTKLSYRWNYSKTRITTMNFRQGHPLLRSSEPSNSFFLFFINEWEEKPIIRAKFMIVCMEDNVPKETMFRKNTSSATTLSVHILLMAFLLIANAINFLSQIINDMRC